MENLYYLAGLIESEINIIVIDKNKIRGIYKHPSAKILYKIQSQFGGKIKKESNANFTLLLFTHDVINMIKSFVLLETKYKKLYEAILDFKINKIKVLNFKEQISTLKKELKNTDIIYINDDYNNGWKDGIDYKIIEDEIIYKNKLIWSKNIEQIKNDFTTNRKEKELKKIRERESKKKKKLKIKEDLKKERRQLLEERRETNKQIKIQKLREKKN